MRRLLSAALAVPLAVVVVACGSDDQQAGAAPRGTTAPAPAATPAPEANARAAGGVKTIATGLRVPWGVGFLPNGDALVAERTTGEIKRVPGNGGRARTVMRVPGVDTNAGEGGLLGLAVSPTFKRDRLVYVYFTTSDDNRIARFKYGSTSVSPILTGLQAAGIHNGGRLAFGPDKELYATVGDAGDTSNAQNRDSLNGKILRMDPDGGVPSDNPFKGSLVYTLGHRNPQGIAWDAKGRMFAAEFGQNTFDEVNRIQGGNNYGWPVVEGRGNTQNGKFTNPLKTWRTSDASPSGIAIRGNRLFMAALGGERLYSMPIRANGTLGADTARYKDRWGRLRTVIAVPGGRGLWLTTSNRDGRGSPAGNDDRIFRIPAN